MKEEPINPSYINQIFELENKRTIFNRSEFVNATVQDDGLNFDYEVTKLEDFIRLRITIKYIQSAIESGTKLEVINFFRGFRISKVSDVYPRDLLVILEYCINLLNEEMLKEKPPLKIRLTEFPAPVWEEHHELFENIAKDLNGN